MMLANTQADCRSSQRQARLLGHGLGLQLALMVLAQPLGAQGAIPPEVRARLLAVLQPDSGQRIEVVVDSDPALFPGTEFILARRLPPPYPSGEDARPIRAAVIVRGSQSQLIDKLDQLPSAWSLASPERIEDPPTALKATLRLLQMTGLVSRGQLLESPSDAGRKVSRSSLRQPDALNQVRAPVAEIKAGAVRICFYASMPLGLYEYLVSIDQSNRLTVHRKLLSPLVTQM